MTEYCPICGQLLDPSHEVRVCTVCDWLGSAAEVLPTTPAIAVPVADLQAILRGHRMASQAFQLAGERVKANELEPTELVAIENNVRDIEQLITNLFIRIINAALHPSNEKTLEKNK